MLSDCERSILLRIARASLERHFGSGDEYVPSLTEALEAGARVFVTLRNKDRLRGCRGTIQPTLPLWLAVQEITLDAAFNDARFESIGRDELPDLSIEISVLSPLDRVKRASDLRIGTHGLMIRCAEGEGLLLPQAAAERHWSVYTFLRQVCIKAGLPQRAWRRPDVVLESFTVEAFAAGPRDG